MRTWAASSTLPASFRPSAVAALDRRHRFVVARGVSVAGVFHRAVNGVQARTETAAGEHGSESRTAASQWPRTGTCAEFDTDRRPESEIIKEADERLRAAVNARLESEVPLGAFLSGGIDSGLVVSYMAETLADRLVTASVGFGEPAHNELEAAGWTASGSAAATMRRSSGRGWMK